MNVYKQRILNVARALRESPAPRKFKMTSYYTCGTPACALGHYASRHDLQDTFTLGHSEGDGRIVDGRLVVQPGFSCSGKAVRTHFGITEYEGLDLFSTCGCGLAQTPQAAIEYLEKFAREKWPEPRRTDSDLVSELVSELMTRVMGERIPEDA